MKRHTSSRNVIESWLIQQAKKRPEGAMKMASVRIDRFFVAATSAVAVALQPASSWAAPAAELPWDRPLEALQQTLISPVAHSLIAMSFIGAVFAHGIAGDSEIARRLAKAGLGVSVGLVLLRLMNFLFP